MNSEKVSFNNGAGERLVGQLDSPPPGVPTRAWALFAHCFTCTRNIRAAREISRALAERGIGVLRFDFTGLGESEGDFADTNFSSNVEDLVAAAHWMAREGRTPGV
ncbi:MAG: osmotically inducible protein C, partial [Pseudomonadota bacterium]